MQNKVASEEFNNAIEKSAQCATDFNGKRINSEHLLYGILMTECEAKKLLEAYEINAQKLLDIIKSNSSGAVISDNGNVVLSQKASEILKLCTNDDENKEVITNAILLKSILTFNDSAAYKFLDENTILDNLLIDAEALAEGKLVIEDEQNNCEKSILSQELLEIGTDLTLKVKEGISEPIIGRNDEIQRIVEVLCRKTKNNPILVGEPGVGKTAVVEGLAQKIVKNEVPNLLKNKTIYMLNVASLLAGTKYRGVLEERLKNVVDFCLNNNNVILFIDEIHTIVTAGSDKGEVSPANMLKPYLSRGELQTIGATTNAEYSKFIESDKPLERRFQVIEVLPPSVEQTIEILMGVKNNYESYHNVKILDSAVKAAVVLSDKFIQDRNLPDKAFDLLDESCSKIKISAYNSLSKISEFKDKMLAIKTDIDLSFKNNELDKCNKLQSTLMKYQNELSSLEKMSGLVDEKGVVDENVIASLVSSITGIPTSKINDTEKNKLMNLENLMHARVIGQNEAINAVCRAIRRSRVGITESNRPIGSFMFLGPTGVGKTEVSKALAGVMFDDESKIIRIDMSEYMQPHTISKLIGSPPGYVGYDEGGELTEQVRKKPYSVVLFDEIEKAHSDIYNLLLQLLDDGRLTDGKGRLVSFKNTIIIMTSNQSSDEFAKLNLHLMSKDSENYKQILFDNLSQKFSKEFLNRIDVITVFEPLKKSDVAKIASLMIKNLSKKLKEKNFDIKFTENSLRYIIKNGYDERFGARPMRRLIQQEIENLIAEEILNEKLIAPSKIIIDCVEDKLTFEFISE